MPLINCEAVSGPFCSGVDLGAPKPNENTGLEVAVFVFEPGAMDPVFPFVLGAGFDEGKLNKNEGGSVLLVVEAAGTVVAGVNVLIVG